MTRSHHMNDAHNIPTHKTTTHTLTLTYTLVHKDTTSKNSYYIEAKTNSTKNKTKLDNNKN